MQRFLVALAGAAIVLAGGCSNKAMEATKADTSVPPSQTAVQQTAPTPAPAPTTASTPVPATAGLPGTTVGQDGALRITVDATSKMLKSGEAVLVDVRTDEQYNTQHAVGALHIPYTQLISRLNEIPQGKYIITYCS